MSLDLLRLAIGAAVLAVAVATALRQRRLALARRRLTAELREEWERCAPTVPPRTPRPVAAEPLGRLPAEAVEELLGDFVHHPALLPAADVDVTTTYDPVTNRMLSSIPVSPGLLALLAHERYADGQSHEQVTAWLEDLAPSFREALSVVETTEGPRWMYVPFGRRAAER